MPPAVPLSLRPAADLERYTMGRVEKCESGVRRGRLRLDFPVSIQVFTYISDLKEYPAVSRDIYSPETNGYGAGVGEIRATRDSGE